MNRCEEEPCFIYFFTAILVTVGVTMYMFIGRVQIFTIQTITIKYTPVIVPAAFWAAVRENKLTPSKQLLVIF